MNSFLWNRPQIQPESFSWPHNLVPLLYHCVNVSGGYSGDCVISSGYGPQSSFLEAHIAFHIVKSSPERQHSLDMSMLYSSLKLFTRGSTSIFLVFSKFSGENRSCQGTSPDGSHIFFFLFCLFNLSIKLLTIYLYINHSIHLSPTYLSSYLPTYLSFYLLLRPGLV